MTWQLATRFARNLKLKLFMGSLHRQSRWLPKQQTKSASKTEVSKLICWSWMGDSNLRPHDSVSKNRPQTVRGTAEALMVKIKSPEGRCSQRTAFETSFRDFFRSSTNTGESKSSNSTLRDARASFKHSPRGGCTRRPTNVRNDRGDCF